MRKQVMQVLLLSLFSLCLVTACELDSQTNKIDYKEETTISSDIPTIQPADEPIQEPIIEPETLAQISILQDDIPYYDGNEDVDGINQTMMTAYFKRHPYIPYGFYIFESMEEYKFEDGTDWGMNNQRSLFSISEKSQIRFEANYENPLLTKYKEYIGSEKNKYGSYDDYFSFRDHGRDLVVRIHYFEEDKDTILPLFLDVFSTIRYISDPTAFQPGIDFKFPEGRDSDEEEVIQLVNRNVEAIVSKDKEIFRSTLTSPEMDFLDFFIDTSTTYRFTKLETIDPYDESTGRINMNIHYEYLQDGIVNQSANIFTSLKGKDGKWKIANID